VNVDCCNNDDITLIWLECITFRINETKFILKWLDSKILDIDSET
jgi:hypothetical protein